MKIHVVLPAYNEEPSIGTLLDKIAAVMSEHGFEYTVVIVDDGSADATADEVAARTETMPIELVTHHRNRGLWETVRDGFERAAELASPEDVIVRMDADDTHEPRYIPDLVRAIEAGHDVVICSRFQPGGGAEGLDGYRTFISRCANLLMKLAFPIKGVREYSCGYRAYRAGLVQDALAIFGNAFIDLKGVGFTCTIEKLLKFRMMGARFGEVPFVLRYDQKMSASKMLSSITTLGYLVLMVKYAHAWGVTGKQWQRDIAALAGRRSGWGEALPPAAHVEHDVSV